MQLPAVGSVNYTGNISTDILEGLKMRWSTVVDSFQAAVVMMTWRGWAMSIIILDVSDSDCLVNSKNFEALHFQHSNS